jgi:predicted RNA binding protein YcfA (HicA-like mRNA interferase family)
VSECFPVCTAKQVIRVLRKHGFALVRQKGSHQKWRHPNGRQVIVPVHGNKPIPIGTLKSMIEGAALTAEDFR